MRSSGFLRDSFAARYHAEIANWALPFLAEDAHICVKPEMMATTAGWLRNVNAAAWKPSEDAASMPSGWGRQAEGSK
ncbi:hypothetical protein LJR220_007144 [Bradyrhizobium sp. LjRoot220]